MCIRDSINDIPSTDFEASEIDGATKTQQFFHITLPNLLPTINFTLLTTIIGAFQVFDVVYVTTGGGPLYKTETVVQYIYNRGCLLYTSGHRTKENGERKVTARTRNTLTGERT